MFESLTTHHISGLTRKKRVGPFCFIAAVPIGYNLMKGHTLYPPKSSLLKKTKSDAKNGWAIWETAGKRRTRISYVDQKKVTLWILRIGKVSPEWKLAVIGQIERLQRAAEKGTQRSR